MIADDLPCAPALREGRTYVPEVRVLARKSDPYEETLGAESVGFAL